MIEVIVKLKKIAKSPWAWFLVLFVYLFIDLAVTSVEVVNNGTSVARDFRVVLVPTKKVYVLGDIAPGESKSLWFMPTHDGQAKYITTIDNAEVTDFAIGYFSAGGGRRCTLRLIRMAGKQNPEC